MEWIFGSDKPTKQDIMLSMLDAQGKMLVSLIEEIQQLSIIINKHCETDCCHCKETVETVETVETGDALVCHMELADFFAGNCFITEESTDTEE